MPGLPRPPPGAASSRHFSALPPKAHCSTYSADFTVRVALQHASSAAPPCAAAAADDLPTYFFTLLCRNPATATIHGLQTYISSLGLHGLAAVSCVHDDDESTTTTTRPSLRWPSCSAKGEQQRQQQLRVMVFTEDCFVVPETLTVADAFVSGELVYMRALEMPVGAGAKSDDDYARAAAAVVVPADVVVGSPRKRKREDAGLGVQSRCGDRQRIKRAVTLGPEDVVGAPRLDSRPPRDDVAFATTAEVIMTVGPDCKPPIEEDSATVVCRSPPEVPLMLLSDHRRESELCANEARTFDEPTAAVVDSSIPPKPKRRRKKPRGKTSCASAATMPLLQQPVLIQIAALEVCGGSPRSAIVPLIRELAESAPTAPHPAEVVSRMNALTSIPYSDPRVDAAMPIKGLESIVDASLPVRGRTTRGGRRKQRRGKTDAVESPPREVQDYAPAVTGIAIPAAERCVPLPVRETLQSVQLERERRGAAEDEDKENRGGAGACGGGKQKKKRSRKRRQENASERQQQAEMAEAAGGLQLSQSQQPQDSAAAAIKKVASEAAQQQQPHVDDAKTAAASHIPSTTTTTTPTTTCGRRRRRRNQQQQQQQEQYDAPPSSNNGSSSSIITSTVAANSPRLPLQSSPSRSSSSPPCEHYYYYPAPTPESLRTLTDALAIAELFSDACLDDIISPGSSDGDGDGGGDGTCRASEALLLDSVLNGILDRAPPPPPPSSVPSAAQVTTLMPLSAAAAAAAQKGKAAAAAKAAGKRRGPGRVGRESGSAKRGDAIWDYNI
ncbi:hypothetical protein HDU86_004903 [Geranomyces michiganensis]|nr:hypothetical protein HDU86_004903 [Geranomyces michiganensis]